MISRVFMSALCISFLLMLCHANSKPTAAAEESEHKSRVVTPKPLSQEPHTLENDEHNPDFDHEAFLGKEKAAEFDELPLEESLQRLRGLCEMIDSDKDGYITREELTNRLEHVSHSYLEEGVMEDFTEHDTNDDNKLSWEEIKSSSSDDTNNDVDEQEVARHQKKFKVCDQNGDQMLDKKEYTAYAHPEEFHHTKDLYIDEIFDEIDKNNDGKITVEEYVADFWTGEEKQENEEEPDWVQQERETFYQEKDLDGDKIMNKHELRTWISPDDLNSVADEVNHLMSEADTDKDGKLSINDEVMTNHELFAGSQVTDFGSYESVQHDEF